MKTRTKTTTCSAWPPAIILQCIHLPIMLSTCGTRTRWLSLCPMTKTPRPAHCCWLPSPTSRLSSQCHTARQVTALQLSPAAKSSASPGRPNYGQGPRSALTISKGTHNTYNTTQMMCLMWPVRDGCHIQCVESSSRVLLLLLIVDVQWEIAFNGNTVSSSLTCWISQNHEPDSRLFSLSHVITGKSKQTPWEGEPKDLRDYWRRSLDIVSMCLSFIEKLLDMLD